jgi:anti-sigma factor ChrR (cupin superfamily)
MNAPTDDRQHGEQALEYAATELVGALAPAGDQSWFRQHLAAGCEICRRAVARITALGDDLLLAAPPVTPPAPLRAQVLAAARAARDGAGDAPPQQRPSEAIQVWAKWTGAAARELTTVPGSDEGWQRTGVAGVSVRPLYVDEQKDLVTMLIRMEAGTAWPRHRHAEDEQCFVLAGDLRVGDEHLHAGDFQFAPADTIHGIQRTEGGCTLLLVSSRHDELLSG